MDANALTNIAAGISPTTVPETPVRHKVQLTLPGGLAVVDQKLKVADPPGRGRGVRLLLDCHGRPLCVDSVQGMPSVGGSSPSR